MPPGPPPNDKGDGGFILDNAGQGNVNDDFKGTQRFENSHHGAANRGLPG